MVCSVNYWFDGSMLTYILASLVLRGSRVTICLSFGLEHSRTLFGYSIRQCGSAKYCIHVSTTIVLLQYIIRPRSRLAGTRRSHHTCGTNKKAERTISSLCKAYAEEHILTRSTQTSVDHSQTRGARNVKSYTVAFPAAPLRSTSKNPSASFATSPPRPFVFMMISATTSAGSPSAVRA